MTRYIELAEYFWLAEQVTGVEASLLAKASRVDLADSGLYAPAAGFGDDDFYPDVFDKAAVLCCRLAWNHPLPDGNKRAAWASLVMFVDLNDGAEPRPARCRRGGGGDARRCRWRSRRIVARRVASRADQVRVVEGGATNRFFSCAEQCGLTLPMHFPTCSHRSPESGSARRSSRSDG